jgi:hypothetical protein
MMEVFFLLKDPHLISFCATGYIVENEDAEMNNKLLFLMTINETVGRNKSFTLLDEEKSLENFFVLS